MTAGISEGRLSDKHNNLETVLSRQLLPTPTARDHKSTKASPETMARNSRPLSETIGALLPTPLASDTKGATTKRKGNTQLTETLGVSSKLNPRFVEEMMGFPLDWTRLNDYPAARKRIAALGNAVVPQLVWRIFDTINRYEALQKENSPASRASQAVQ